MKFSDWKQPTPTQIRRRGIFLVAFAVLAAAIFLPDVRKAPSPLLYIVVIGGIFVALPAAIGIAVISGRLGRRK
jgi:hypothetical protein